MNTPVVMGDRGMRVVYPGSECPGRVPRKGKHAFTSIPFKVVTGKKEIPNMVGNLGTVLLRCIIEVRVLRVGGERDGRGGFLG